jgi:hypothetical protein
MLTQWLGFGAQLRRLSPVMGCLLALGVALVLATPVHAEEPISPEDEKGCSCHSAEKETWQMSPHAEIMADGQPAAMCETCHGAYVRGHPDEGMVQLAIDATVCSDCHAKTAGEWENTIHAEAGIQCTSCHVSHSQDLRLAEEMLCESCHRDAVQDPLHVAHWIGDAGCTSCHVGEPSHAPAQSIASANPADMLVGTPGHDFVAVSASKCLDCHAEAVTAVDGAPKGKYAVRTAMLKSAEEAPILRNALTAAEQNNRALALLSPVSLGFGISIGGLLGIVFMLAMVRLSQPKKGGRP